MFQLKCHYSLGISDSRWPIEGERPRES